MGATTWEKIFVFCNISHQNTHNPEYIKKYKLGSKGPKIQFFESVEQISEDISNI